MVASKATNRTLVKSLLIESKERFVYIEKIIVSAADEELDDDVCFAAV